MSKKHKKVCRVLNYIDHLLFVISGITGCVSISAFASLVCIPIGIAFSIIIKLAKSKLNSMGVLISKALIDLHFIHDEFVLINNVLKKFYDVKEEIKNSNYR